MGACCAKCCKKPEVEKPKGMIPSENRKCRDVCCILLFIIFWIGMIVVASIAVANGDPKRLIYGVDYRGMTCGDASTDTSGKIRIVYPRMSEDLLLNMEGGVIKTNPLDYKFYGICVSECPKAKTILCNLELSADAAALTQEEKQNCYGGSGVSKSSHCPEIEDNCWIIPLDMSSIFYRCLPDYVVTKNSTTKCVFPPGIADAADPACSVKLDTALNTLEQPAQPNLLYDKVNQARALWGRWVGDVARAWWVIAVCGVVVALVLGFVWLLLLKWCTGIMVFLTVLLVVLLMIAITFFCYFKAGILDPTFTQSLFEQAGSTGGSLAQTLVPSTENTTKYKYAAYFFTAVDLVLFLVLIAIRKAIVAAVHIIKKAAQALQSHKFLVLYPLVTVTLLFGLMVYWVFIGASMMSAGETLDVSGLQESVSASISKLNDEFPGYNNSVNASRIEAQSMKFISALSSTRYLFAYHFFGLLWTNQVIQAIGMVTIAGCIAQYYFTKNVVGEDGEPIPQGKWPVFASFWRGLRYNFGSICFGSLLIALLQFIRVLFEYLRHRMAEYEKRNATVKVVMKCIQCCLCLVQKCLEVITRNAFIYIAVKNSGFLTGAGAAVKLIIGNIVELAVVNTIGEILMFLGKMFVTCCSAFICFLMLDKLPQFSASGDDQLTSTWLPVLMTMFFAFFTASAFFYVFDMAIDTILLCYCIDKSENNGNPVHMSSSEVIGKKTLASSDSTAGMELTGRAKSGSGADGDDSKAAAGTSSAVGRV